MMIKNAIKCKKSGEVIESVSLHDFKICLCGACAVGGGHEYTPQSQLPSTDCPPPFAVIWKPCLNKICGAVIAAHPVLDNRVCCFSHTGQHFSSVP